MFLARVLQASIFTRQSCCCQSRPTNSASDCYVMHNEINITWPIFCCVKYCVTETLPYATPTCSIYFITYTILRYARRQNPLKCAYFHRLQAAVILTKGLLSKYAKLIILQNVVLNQRTRSPDLP